MSSVIQTITTNLTLGTQYNLSNSSGANTGIASIKPELDDAGEMRFIFSNSTNDTEFVIKDGTEDIFVKSRLLSITTIDANLTTIDGDLTAAVTRIATAEGTLATAVTNVATAIQDIGDGTTGLAAAHTLAGTANALAGTVNTAVTTLTNTSLPAITTDIGALQTTVAGLSAASGGAHPPGTPLVLNATGADATFHGNLTVDKTCSCSTITVGVFTAGSAQITGANGFVANGAIAAFGGGSIGTTGVGTGGLTILGTINGNTTNGLAVVNGNSTFGGNVEAASAVTAGAGITAAGDLTVAGDSTLNTGLTVNGTITNQTGIGLIVANTAQAGGNVVTSDLRLKENLLTISKGDGLNIINQLQPQTYNFINDTDKNKRAGLIAQDVQPILDHVVSYDNNNDKYSLNYNEIIPYLISAVQNLSDKVDSQQQQIDSLIN